MPPAFSYPPKPKPGDAVAVLSPSGRSPSRFPAPYELGLSRLREEFRLLPVEYQTTRAADASPAARAADIHAAFADPDIKAVISTIGGEDELKVLAHLDPRVLAANPKPFFGYSDNTNLHLFLWRLGMVSYHGGAVMVQFGRPHSMHPRTRDSLERALFTDGRYVLEPVEEYSDEERDWSDPDALALEQPMFRSDDWSWHGAQVQVTGRAWGGSLEIVDFHLRTRRHLMDDDAYDGTVLFLETSEEMPSETYVYRLLMNIGERGLLQRFAAVLWGRPKAWSREQPNRPPEKARYVEAQREAVLAAVREYHPAVPLVFGVDFGHTEPQYVIPSGGEVTLDAAAKRIEVTY
jgi:muramoyltetrapeptide carboxypeptidase LdcA involved in peptidoglycan recycling